MTDLTPDDLRTLDERGIDPSEIERQRALFRDPPPPARLERPCTPGDGVHRLPDAGQMALVERHAAAAAAGRIMKFVPASGAASRMFRDLVSARDLAPAGRADDPAVRRLLEHLDDFPFASDLRAELERRGGRADDPGAVLDALLDTDGLDAASRPKGLLPFHRYPAGARTAFEEHLVEAADYARAAGGTARLHVTVSPEHRAGFEALREDTVGGATRFDVAFSSQDPATDTVAVDEAGDLVRLDDGSLLFRPGGHGALLGNIERAGGDLLLVKNIDNVVPDRRKGPTLLWKKLLAGLLVDLVDTVHRAVRDLRNDPADGAAAARGREFTARWLGREAAEAVGDDAEALRARLDRPLRVCGVVRNQGEPGGGPFWVRDPEGGVTPQIVESAQVADDPDQRAVWESSTHFNPVDLALSVLDPDGRAYDLPRFVDERTAILTRKSHEGRPITVLERPGLWNGAMAGWNTVFVEVPIETFAPVKTVFDLLRPEHQPGD